MVITRKAIFGFPFLPLGVFERPAELALFGEESHAAGHGHNFVLEVSVEGEPDPLTGMIVDLKELKDILEREIVAPMDHRFLEL